MNRINPMHIAILLISILVILFVRLESKKDELSQIKQSYKESLKLSTELVQLKKVYRQKLRLPSSLSSLVVQKKIKNGVAISSKKMQMKTLNSLMGKVLNGAYRITQLNIKRLNDTQVSFYMEIQW